MAIALLFINLFGLIIISFSLKEIRLSLLKGVLFFSLLLLVITEVLSLFNALNYWGLLLCWGSIDVLLIYLILKKKSFRNFIAVKNKLKKTYRDFSGLEKFLLGFSVIILLGIFFQGIIYPTNNWDAMSYHMARIVHWVQNESLVHYRTPVYPQLNSPPFVEQVMLTVNLLVGNDYFSNTVQWFYLLTTCAAISLVAKQLGLKRFGQILSAFILICIPEVILLGSSTHSEIVLSFFMVSSIYFLLKTSKQQEVLFYLLLGCSLGLSVATKSTAYVYLSSFILIWLAYQIYQVVIKKGQLKWLSYTLLILSFIAVNAGHYSRNYQLTSTVFGTDETIRNYYVNEEHSLKMMVSNVSRNLSNQFGVPKVAPVAQHLTEDLHQLIGRDVNDPKITFGTYLVDPLATHENNGANAYHMVLILLSCVLLLIFIKKQDKRMAIYWAAIILSFLVFCFYLKWQPWVKLHVPFFIFYAIVLAYFLITRLKSKVLRYVLIFGFVSQAVLILLFNYSRPYITLTPYTSEIKITDVRYKKYFSRFLQYHDDYKAVSKKIATQKLKNIGLMFGSYDMEYQLFIDSYRNNVKPVHINSCGLSEKIPVTDKVDCIVSTKYEDSINYSGETFYNATPNNDGHLYLFLKK